MKQILKIAQKLAVLFSLTLCLNSSAYADLSTILINSAAFTIGYSLNPVSWVLAAFGGAAGVILSFPIKKLICKELPIGFGIGIGVGLPIARIANFHSGQFDWIGFLAQTGDSGFHGLLGCVIYIVLRKFYRKMKFSNLQDIDDSSRKYPNYKFIIFIFLFVIFSGQVTTTLMGIRSSAF